MVRVVEAFGAQALTMLTSQGFMPSHVIKLLKGKPTYVIYFPVS